MGDWSKLTSMELTDEEKLDTISSMPAVASQPDYPYGLRICLTSREFKKMGIPAPENIGDVIDMRCFAEVKSISQDKDANGEECCRVEMQITHIMLENETEEVDDSPKGRRSRVYDGGGYDRD